MINNNKIMKRFSALLMLLATTASFAQVGDDTSFTEDVVDNPIDANIWMLILVGLGYVFYKYRKSMKYNRL
ncbi:hypothetical protein MCEGE10_00176 [Flavobacteriaceae bacterium]